MQTTTSTYEYLLKQVDRSKAYQERLQQLETLKFTYNLQEYDLQENDQPVNPPDGTTQPEQTQSAPQSTTLPTQNHTNSTPS